MKAITSFIVLVLLQSSSAIATKIRQNIQKKMIHHF
jgi:hypothetical protein